MNSSRYLSAKATLGVCLFLIALLFVGSTLYANFAVRAAFTQQEVQNQAKLSRALSHSLSEYFEKMQLVAEYAAKSPAFDPDRTEPVDRLRYLPFYANHDTVGMHLDSLLQYVSPLTPTPPKRRRETPYVWQVFKGLPERNSQGAVLANERRSMAKATLEAFPGLHYVFELDANGDMIFLHPFDAQKNISRFNYSFRDYYKEVTRRGVSVLSEGYISRDRNGTRIITVASPIRDKHGEIRKIFAVAIAADSLRQQLFGPLARALGPDSTDATILYLVDRHGHIVTATSDSVHPYLPVIGAPDDDHDPGNIRSLPPLAGLPWTTDTLEPSNDHVHRRTKNWSESLPHTPVSRRYRNVTGTMVLGTFLPLSILDSHATRWGVLVETPVSKINARARQSLWIFYLAGLFLTLVLVTLSAVLFRSFSRVEEDLQEVAERVSHNIRGPLAALDLLTQSYGHLPEERRILIRSAVNRIQDIANDLVSNRRRGVERSAAFNRSSTAVVLMSSVVSEIVSEKRIQYRPRIDLTIESDVGSHSYGLFAAISPTQLRPVLSNIIDNSADAIETRGTIRVSLAGDHDIVRVTVSDTGKGIPPAVLSRLGTKHFSYGKVGGKGLGLFEAKRVVEGWGGHLQIASEVGRGTTLTVTIPKGDPPKWFVPQIQLCEGMLLAVVDDDQSIHQIWSDRLTRRDITGPKIQVRHFSSPGEFVEFMRGEQPYPHRLFLVDFEYLGDSRDGMSVIEEFGIADESILVTSHFEHREILRRAELLGVGVLPKSMAPYIPIRVQARRMNHEEVV